MYRTENGRRRLPNENPAIAKQRDEASFSRTAYPLCMTVRAL